MFGTLEIVKVEDDRHDHYTGKALSLVVCLGDLTFRQRVYLISRVFLGRTVTFNGPAARCARLML